ncbi:MAG: hypothetical protein JWM27_1172 [Gemmatimonadetes bacterium]|nr:hypothetical protein [Gemmatimonadota bacterium]
MNPITSLCLAAACVALSGHGLSPEAGDFHGPPAPPHAISDPTDPKVSVAHYGAATGASADSNTAAIKRAIAHADSGAHEVWFPAGTYQVNPFIELHGNTLVHGAGRDLAVLVDTASGWETDVFRVYSQSGITVSDLGFKALRPTQNQFAVHAFGSHYIIFRNNRATGIGLIKTKQAERCETPDSVSRLDFEVNCMSSDIQVLDSHGTGPGQDRGLGSNFAVRIEYSRDVLIARVSAERYWGGFALSGGDSDRGHLSDRPGFDRNVAVNQTWVKDVTMEFDTIVDTNTGFFTSRSESVEVRYGYAEKCLDICLDAEGSTNVTYHDNTALTAWGATAAAYFRNRNVRFSWNTLTQNGARLPVANSVFARVLFRLKNDGDTSPVSLWLSHNTLQYTGADSFGEVNKETSTEFYLANNTLTNTRIQLALKPPAGYTEVTDNGVGFTRPLPAGDAAVDVGDNLSAGHSGTYIARNEVYSSVAQLASSPAILVHEPGLPLNQGRIEQNRVRGFARAVQLGGGMASPRFDLIGNVAPDGSIVDLTAAGASRADADSTGTWRSYLSYWAASRSGRPAQAPRRDMQVAGIAGQAPGMEGLWVQPSVAEVGTVCYRVQAGGSWGALHCNVAPPRNMMLAPALAGTGTGCIGTTCISVLGTGVPAKPIRRLRIYLMSNPPNTHICYRVWSGTGWLREACDAANVGDRIHDIEAIRIRYVPAA